MGFTVAESQLPELFCTYAALILHDDKAPITGENMQKLIAAAGGKIPPFWPKLFSNLLQNNDVTELLAKGGGGGGAGAAAAAGAGDAAAEPEPEEEEEEEEEETDMGFSLFD